MDVYALLQQQLLRSFLKSSKCVCTHRSPLLLVQMWPQTSENLRRMQREWGYCSRSGEGTPSGLLWSHGYMTDSLGM